MQDEIELDYSEMNERCRVDIPPNVNWGKPKEENQFTHAPSYKKLWEQWTDTQKADFLEDLYKEQEEYCMSMEKKSDDEKLAILTEVATREIYSMYEYFGIVGLRRIVEDLGARTRITARKKIEEHLGIEIPIGLLMSLGDKFTLDKTKHRLLPIKETETESTVEYKVVEK